MVMDHEKDDIEQALQEQTDQGDIKPEEEYAEPERMPPQAVPPMSPLERALHVPSAAEENPVRELFTPVNLKMKSEIPPGLIIPLARAYVIAEKTGSRILKQFCFPAGTEVIIKNPEYEGGGGTSDCITKNIEDIVVGDEALSYNEQTGEKEFKPVLAVGSREYDKFITVNFSSGNELTMTDDHPVGVVGGDGKLSWVKARDLKIGMNCIELQYKGLYHSILRRGKTYEEIYGKDAAELARARQSETHRELCENPEIIEKKRYAAKCGWENPDSVIKRRESIAIANGKPEVIERRQEGTRRSWEDSEIREKRSSGIQKAWDDHKWNNGEEFCQMRKEVQKKRWKDPEYKKKMRQAHLKKWENPEYRKKMEPILNRAHAAAAGGESPNKFESYIYDRLKKDFPGQWSFVGNGNIRIGGLNPDIIHRDGKKKIIELLGCYWHKCSVCGFGSDEERKYRSDELVIRRGIFNDEGYDVLELWEHEDYESIKGKVTQFLYNPKVKIVTVDKLTSFEKIGTRVYNLTVADNHNCYFRGILGKQCNEILLLQISKDRRGRIEYMESVVAARHREDELD